MTSKRPRPSRTSVLDGIPERMPPLQLAEKLLSRAERLGMERSGAAPKPTPTADIALTEDALGERILALVQLGRDAGLDSERALRRAIRRLTHSIRATESQASERNRSLDTDRNAPLANQEGVTQALAPIGNAGMPGAENDASALVAVRMKLPEINPTRGVQGNPNALWITLYMHNT